MLKRKRSSSMTRRNPPNCRVQVLDLARCKPMKVLMPAWKLPKASILMVLKITSSNWRDKELEWVHAERKVRETHPILKTDELRRITETSMWWLYRSLHSKIIRIAHYWELAKLRLTITGLISSKILKMISWGFRRNTTWALILITRWLLSQSQIFVGFKERVSKKPMDFTCFKLLSKFAANTPTSVVKATSKQPWQPKTKTRDRCLPFKAMHRVIKKRTFAKWATSKRQNRRPTKKPMTNLNNYSRCSSPSTLMTSTLTWGREPRRRKEGEKERLSSGKWGIQLTCRCSRIKREEVISICGSQNRLRRVAPSINHLRRMRDTYLSETKARSRIKN